ncbi:phage baseplate assembly protein V [Dyella sp. M7H15-1]|uniref:phage baseplate assembly protein V n=1 Tax=Dyella sp. M7H15-1 TaxID=2501295 RepID=UPI0013E8B299|nr:phage baseplate assembly protein V [Dyella sp. M7H15-1]
MSAEILGELQRRLCNLLQQGTVQEVDDQQGFVRVACGELLTPWLRWFVPAAGEDSAWCVPSVGEQVMVLCPFGDPALGWVLRGIYSDAFPPPADKVTLQRARYRDGTLITYDSAAHVLTVDASQSSATVTVVCKAATVKADDSITLDTPSVHCTQDLWVEGSVYADSVAAKTEVSAGNVKLTQHDHVSGEPGQPTSPPRA